MLKDVRIAVIGLGYVGLPLAVAHDQFMELDFSALKNGHGVIYDIKSLLPKGLVEGRL